MVINKERCQAYHDTLLTLVHMTKELSDDEYDYIMAMFHTRIGKITMEKLQKKGAIEKC